MAQIEKVFFEIGNTPPIDIVVGNEIDPKLFWTGRGDSFVNRKDLFSPSGTSIARGDIPSALAVDISELNFLLG